MTEDERIVNLVGVRFNPADRVQYFDPADIDLDVGDRVAVDTEDGSREAVVVIAPSQVLYSELRGSLKSVLSKIGPPGFE